MEKISLLIKEIEQIPEPEDSDKEVKPNNIVSKELSFKMINLCIFMLTVGCNFDIEGKSRLL